MQNNVIDNIDFQQEKREEMLQDAHESIEKCSICGGHINSSSYVYKMSDGTYAHEQCMLDRISEDCLVFGDVLENERDRKSTEEIF